MRDDRCVVEVGIHPGPYWLGNGKPFCDRHRRQMEERDDLGPLTWEPVPTPWSQAESKGDA